MLLSLIKRTVIVMAGVLVVAACRKSVDSEYDKLSKEMSGTLVSYVESGNAFLFNGYNYAFTPDYVGVPVKLNSAAGAADTVFATVDTSLVATYNAMFNENNPMIPSGAFVASHNGAYPVAAGAIQSPDSLYAMLKDGTGLKDSITYLVPIRLHDKNGVGIQPSVMFFKMLVTFTNMSVKIGGGTGYPFYFYGGMYFSSLLYIPSTGVVTPPAKIKIGVQLSARYPLSDLYVDAQAYNDAATVSAVSSSYSPWPDDTYSLANTHIRIPANSLYGEDSIEVSIQNYSSFVLFKSYMTVVKLKPYASDSLSVPLAKDSTSAILSMFVY